MDAVLILATLLNKPPGQRQRESHQVNKRFNEQNNGCARAL